MNIKKKNNYFTAIELSKMFPELNDLCTEQLEYGIQYSSSEFHESNKSKVSIFIRFTMPFALIVVVILIVLMPINFLVTGYWRYRSEKLSNWLQSVGF